MSCHARNSGDASTSAKFMINIMMRGGFELDDDVECNTMSFSIELLEELARRLLLGDGTR